MNYKTGLLIAALMYFIPTNNTAQIFSEQSITVGIDHTFQPKGLMGGGAAFFDFDNDGDDDLYLVGGLASDNLYRNEGNGTFTKINTSAAGFELTFQYNTTAVITGDVDNDGDRDIFLSTWERNENGGEVIARNLLYENQGNGQFEEIGETAGITHAAFSIGANFVDYNKDGWLDIHVMNHVDVPGFLYDNNGVIVGFDHECYDNFFYRNNGDLTFTEVSTSLGVNNDGCALAALPSDYDLDGDQDIFIANDFGPFIVPNVLYQNDFPNDAFLNVGAATGADIPMYGMGVAAGDYDQDLDLDYYITNLGANVLMENDNGNFTDVAATAQVENTYAGMTTDFSTGWGTAFFDIDNDSWLDLFVANGRIPSLSTLPTNSNDPNKLFQNNGDKTFSDISDANNVSDGSYSRGMAYSDFDGDGDVDFIVVNQDELGGTTKFYRNDLSSGAHYLQFSLVGKESNRDGYGAKIWLYAGDKTFLKELDGGGGSFCSHSSSVVHFGLGDIDQVDSVRIDWPNGHVDHLGTFDIDQRHVVEEGIITDATHEVVTNLGITLSPNPFEQFLDVRADQHFVEQSEVRLYGQTGKLLWQEKLFIQKGNNRLQLDEKIPPGIYMLQLLTKEGIQIEKNIKQ